MIRVVVVDDHPHVAIAMRTLLDETPEIQLVAEAKQGLGVAALIRKTLPDLLLLDVFLEPEFDARSTVRRLRTDFPNLKICLLSAYIEPSLVRDLLQVGAHGYILKDDDYVSKIDTIIRDIVSGKIYLSPQAYEALAKATRSEERGQVLSEREIEVLRLAKRGLPNLQIAQALNISPGTVRNHLSSIYRKLDVHTRYEALRIAEERNLL